MVSDPYGRANRSVTRFLVCLTGDAPSQGGRPRGLLLVRLGEILSLSDLSCDPDRGRSRPVTGGHVRRGSQFWDTLRSAGVGLLLLSVVISTIAGAEAALLFTVLAAWLLFPLLVGLERTLDAGCAFMLISVGVVLVVSAAQNGPGSLLP